MIRRLFQGLRPPYSLKTILLLALSALALFMVVLNGVISHQRISRETMAAAKQQAGSIAILAARTISESLIVNDLASIEASLLELAQLPGVDAITAVRKDGRILSEVHAAGGAVIASLGRRIELPAGDALRAALAGQVHQGHFEIWSAIRFDSGAPLGWVRVDYSLAPRELELERLQRRSVYTLLGTIAAILLILPFLLERALRPIRSLSDFAGNLSHQIGSHIRIASTNLEANVLAAALNKASRDMAEQIARNQVIVNTAAVAIISLDAQGRVLSANPATTSIFGQEERDLQGLPLEQSIPGLHAAALRELFGGLEDSAARVYRIVRHDFFGVRHGGTRFPVEITLGQAPQGGSLRYVCIVRDVTDERAALETSELYERALASSHNGVFISNAAMAEQPIIFVNDALQRISGLGAHQLLGRSMDLLLNGDREDPSYRELRQAVAEQRSTSVTLRHRLGNGHEITAEVSLSPVRSEQGRLSNFVGIVSDVTARVQAEQAIAERSAQLDAIFSLSPDGFVLFDEDGRMVFANPALERMTGLAWRQSGPPMTMAAFEQELATLCHPLHPLPPMQTLDGGDTPGSARLTLSRPQHRVLQAQSRRNLAGRCETILYFRDVTHEDEVDRMKSEFLASAAHELRTPMVSIFGFTELLLKRSFNEERRTDMLQTIHRQSGLLVKMINELLDLARIESRRGLDLQIGQHRLGTLVEDSVKGLMRQEGERQVSVGIVPEVQVLIDPEKMQLALNNLLSNAFKYSPEGGDVTLSARVAAHEARSYAVLEVRDQGIGMKPDQLARAFERFYRADSTGNIPGTGLGLSLVKEVAELHQGRVELASEFGVGTTAWLWIPLADAAPPAGP